MNPAPTLLLRGAIPTRSPKARHKVRRRGRNRKGVPAQSVWSRIDGIEPTGQQTVIHPLEITMDGGRPDPVQPAAAVAMTRGSKGGSRELFRVQPISHPLGG